MAPQNLEVDHRKACTICSSLRDVLVRCQIDSTGKWHFVCPGTCWRNVSGGEIDGDGHEEHKWYRYGGMWKNKHEAVSAKKPKKKQNKLAGKDMSGGTTTSEGAVECPASKDVGDDDTGNDAQNAS